MTKGGISEQAADDYLKTASTDLLEACQYTLSNLEAAYKDNLIKAPRHFHAQLGESMKLLAAAVNKAEGDNMGTQITLLHELLSAIRAISARIHGIFDDPDLMQVGPLTPDVEGDILAITDCILDRYGRWS